MQRLDENALDLADAAPLELGDPAADPLGDTHKAKNRGDKDKEAATSHKQEKPESEEADQKKSKTIITLISDNIKAISVALTNLILIGALLGFIAVIITELRVSAVLLDQIEVPELLQKKGITATAVSQRLLDEIRRIQRASGENSSRRRLLEPAWTREREDIQMPVGNLSVRSAV